jgi:uroporphyrinogen-III decarboxylase
MNSRQRVERTLNHQPPDRVPLDLGASATTGMHASSVYLLLQALILDAPGTPEEIRAQVRQRLGIFGTGGGFVFNTIHNVQARIPVENLLALYQAVADYRG